MSERDVIKRMIDACYNAGQTKYGNPLGSHAGMSAAARVLLEDMLQNTEACCYVLEHHYLRRYARSIGLDLTSTSPTTAESAPDRRDEDVR